MKCALVGLVLFGCGTSAAPVATTPFSGSARESEPIHGASEGSTVKLELVEGVASTLPDGTTVDAKNVLYAHADSKNLSLCTLGVARGGQKVELVLANEHGGSNNGAATKNALGWQFTLQRSDPYQRPSRATVEAKKL